MEGCLRSLGSRPPFCSCANMARGMLKKVRRRRPLSCCMLERLLSPPCCRLTRRRSEESDQVPAILDASRPWLLMNLAGRPACALERSCSSPRRAPDFLPSMPRFAGAALALNELAETRHAMLAGLVFAGPSRVFNAEQIDDYLDARGDPAGRVLMNPPFSASPQHRRESMRDATVRHIRHRPLRRLSLNGRPPRCSDGEPTILERSDITKALYADLRRPASFRFHRDRRRPASIARHGTKASIRGSQVIRPGSGNSGGLIFWAGHAAEPCRTCSGLLETICRLASPFRLPAGRRLPTAAPFARPVRARLHPLFNASSAPARPFATAADYLRTARATPRTKPCVQRPIYEPY